MTRMMKQIVASMMMVTKSPMWASHVAAPLSATRAAGGATVRSMSAGIPPYNVTSRTFGCRHKCQFINNVQCNKKLHLTNILHWKMSTLSEKGAFVITRGVPCQHGFMCGCKQWNNYINESN